MKILNWTLLFLIFFVAIKASLGQAQLTLEFDANEYICSYHNFEGVNLYASFDSDNNEIKIYNTNHQLQTSLIYDPENLYNGVYIYGLSKDVFNSDGNIEFLIYTVGADGSGSSVSLINDKNEILQEFEGIATVRTIGDKNYIVESVSATNYDQALNQPRINKSDKLYELKGKFRKITF